MTDIEQKALALLNEVRDERGFRLNVEMQREDMAQEALCRAIEQHEAFRRDVSDAVTGFDEYGTEAAWERLSRFIIPKTDPLVEAIKDCELATLDGIEEGVAYDLRAAIKARGGRIVWEGE